MHTKHNNRPRSALAKGLEEALDGAAEFEHLERRFEHQFLWWKVGFLDELLGLVKLLRIRLGHSVLLDLRVVAETNSI